MVISSHSYLQKPQNVGMKFTKYLFAYYNDEYCDGTFGGKTRRECVLKPGNFLLSKF